MLGPVFGQRTEENVDRPPFALAIADRAQVQPAAGDGHDGARTQHVDMLPLDLRALLRIGDRHAGGAAEDFGEHAFVVRRQMGDDDKGKTAIAWNRSEKLLQGLDAPGRGANADNRKVGRHEFILFLVQTK